ncbi:aldehyde dehydrogenase [Pluteus cervinus]|uniref:Aldehyde dehydrogenase n=1 Tax=Pluteus cervinus TaxID=181527 RepID=A0ACD3B887_9AGAR|nr:aldehyde dehydrogenase [Pluteus cervinus]
MTGYTSLEDIPKIREELRTTFRSGVTKPLAYRRHQLLQVARMVQENAEVFVDAIVADVGRPRHEVYFTEIGPTIERFIICANKLEEWTAPEDFEGVVPDWQKSWKPKVYKAAKGNVLIIAPWNYPLILSLQPLYGAISAGCTAVLKPSEISANYAATLARLAPKYLDQSAYRVVLGGVSEITRVLELQWDYIFYTGNGKIGRIIAAAAAKHLTPATLELGGKSPVFIDDEFDVDLAAKRVLWGKINNAGQICVAPDYVLISKHRQDAFVQALKKHYAEFYPDGALKSDSYGRIVNETHHARLVNVLKGTKGTIVVGGKAEGREFEPTVVKDVKSGDSLLDEEIFGPILPIVPVENLTEAINFLNERDHPLVIYAFSTNEQTQQFIRENTTSGGLVFNDTFQQLAVNELPFGGVGESGYGRQVLRYSFDLFSYGRSSVEIPTAIEPMLAIRYPPYTKEHTDIMSASVKLKIPEA